MHVRGKLAVVAGLVALLLTLSSGALAAGLEAYATGGYAALAMTKVNEYFDDANTFWKSLGGTYEPLEHITRALWGEGGLRYSLTPTLLFAGGIRYLVPNGSDFRASYTDPSTGKTTVSGAFSGAVWGPTLTVGTPFAIPNMPVTVNLAGILGYYFLTVDVRSEQTAEVGGPSRFAVKGGASGLGFGVRGQLAYALSDHLRLEAGLGYERLSYAEVEVREATGDTPYQKGDPLLTDDQGKPIPFDLSGIRATIGLSFSF